MLKHIIYSFIILACCCFSNSSNAQSAPGLLGKRLLVTYDYNTHFNYSPPVFWIEEEDRNFFNNSTIISKHLFGADYVLSRTLSLGVDFGFHQQRLDDLTLSFDGFKHRVSTNEFGLRLKYFPAESGGSIAPVGPYLQFRVLRYAYRSEMELVPLNNNNLTEPFVFDYEQGSTLTGAFGFGRQGILAGNIIYNVGCEMALVLTENALLDLEPASEDLRNALFLGNMFKLKLGIAVPIY